MTKKAPLWMILLLAAIAFAIVAWFIPAPIHFWRDDQRIVMALSIVGAAAFVRAARGLPNFAPGHVDSKTAKHIVDEANFTFRLVRYLILICFLNISWLIILSNIYAPLEQGRSSTFASTLESGLSSIEGALAGIVISLTWMTLRGDLSLLKIQGDVALKIAE
ncbi:MAG TPA: hypothetical protein VGS13_12075 [Stellaceae bacterium]|nr:hypothetical protein [Stellaceae bacterium]